MKLKILVGLLAIVLSPAYADPSNTYFDGLENAYVFRDAKGNLTPRSRKGLKLLREAARENGTVMIWVSFDLPFQADPELRVPEVVEREAAARAAMIEQVILPLSKSISLIETPDDLRGAPGCMVLASARGVSALARDKRVKHISYQS